MAAELAADERCPDLLARIRVTGLATADPVAAGLAGAISRRRTDRRAFGGHRVPPATLAYLGELVEAEGAHLHAVPDGRVPELAVAVAAAAHAEYFDPGHRSELTRWTHRPAWTGDGVPPATAVEPSVRRVPARNLFRTGSPGLLPGVGGDQGAAYVILYGDGGRPLNLLRGGEAMSALFLGATVEGLSSAPISEAVEVAWPRQLLGRLLPGPGEAFLVVRLGYPDSDEVLPVSPRREVRDTVHVDE